MCFGAACLPKQRWLSPENTLGVAMPLIRNMERLVARTIELLGGKERFKQVTDAEFLDMRRRWELDVTNIGRILRAHLYVEYYLTLHIAKANPRLGDISKARLSFAQKVSLLDTSHDRLRDLVPGIRQINAVRNRLAHQLAAAVTDEDAQVFLSLPMFTAMRNEGAKPDLPSSDPIDVFEKFAQYAAHLLANEFSEFAIAIGRAIDEDAAEGDA